MFLWFTLKTRITLNINSVMIKGIYSSSAFEQLGMIIQLKVDDFLYSIFFTVHSQYIDTVRRNLIFITLTNTMAHDTD